MVANASVLFDNLSFDTDINVKPGIIERLLVNKISSVISNLRCNTTDVDAFRFDYLLKEISSKSPFSSENNSPLEREQLAIAKTLKANAHCQSFNESESWNDPEVVRILRRARNIVSDVLGEFSFNVYKGSSFSKGASTTHPVGLCSPFYKYASLEYGGMEVTPSALTRLLTLIKLTPTMSRCLTTSTFKGIDAIKLSHCDRVKTVPKNSKIDRTILIQPAGNNLLQKAIGKYISNRLRKFGVDLSDQSVNQELSRVGSLYHSHSTIDLSSASDTVNYRVVWELLPQTWFDELDKLRCTEGLLPDGTTTTWHMFSAMGNAFTFELESLIFYAVSKAACDELGSYVGRINVFGDDIIVPNSCGPYVCEMLTKLGFIVNDDKTFVSGDFRESCGSHWYRGICVKPFYIRTPLIKVEQIIRLANQLRQWSADNGICDPRTFKIWEWLSTYVPSILHGGWDLSSSYSLVTAKTYRKRMKLNPLVYHHKLSGESALAATMQSWLSVDTDVGGVQKMDYVELSSKRTSAQDGDTMSITNMSHFELVRNRDFGRYTSPPVWFLQDSNFH